MSAEPFGGPVLGDRNIAHLVNASHVAAVEE